MKMQALALASLAAAAIGGIAWVFIYPLLSGEKKAESRRATVAKSEPAARNVDKTQRSRREQVEGTLKDLEARRAKEKKVPLSVRLTQAGLSWSTQKFTVVSAVLAARRGLRASVRADAAAGGELLRHRGRDPAKIRRQPVRGARQSLQGAARPQEDGGKDSGDVDGGQGFGRHHRRDAARSDDYRLHNDA